MGVLDYTWPAGASTGSRARNWAAVCMQCCAAGAAAADHPASLGMPFAEVFFFCLFINCMRPL